MNVAVAPALNSERIIIDRLLELNAYEFSRLDGRTIGSDGRYGYPYLDTYWSQPGRFPYLIRVDTELAGFALVSVFDGRTHMSEFLVLPKFRRSHVGTRAARQVFAHHPGSWRIEQVAGHQQATQFWRQVVPTTFSEDLATDGRISQSFTT